MFNFGARSEKVICAILTTDYAVVLGLARLNLIDELFEPLRFSELLLFFSDLALLSGDSNDHRCELHVGDSIDFILGVHIVILVEIDCLGAEAVLVAWGRRPRFLGKFRWIGAFGR